MMGCSSRAAQCPPGFLPNSLVLMGLLAVALPVALWFLGRRVEAQLRDGNVTLERTFFTFWPWFGPLPVRRVRFLVGLAPWTPLVAVPVVLIALGSAWLDGGPGELRLVTALFLFLWGLAACAFPWAVRLAVRRAGGLPEA